MKDFFGRYMYDIVKMFVNQFAISIFGSVLVSATAFAGNDVLTLIVSIFSITFYLFLIYTMTWEIGAKDKISVDVGKKKYKPMTGLWMAMVANIPNFIIAVAFLVASPMAAEATWAGNTIAFLQLPSFILQGMYRGVMMTLKVGGVELMKLWWTYFLITIPGIFITWFAYFLGHRDFRFFSFIKQQNKNESK